MQCVSSEGEANSKCHLKYLVVSLKLIEGLARKFWESEIAGILLILNEEGALSRMSNTVENHPRNSQSVIPRLSI